MDIERNIISEEVDFNTIYSHNNKKVPRVTDVLHSTISEDGLLVWANSIGKQGKDYKTTLSDAADIGTIVHEQIDKYLKRGIRLENPHAGFLSFLEWYEPLCKFNKVSVIYNEKTITSPWFGGTVDLVLKINGAIYLVDFKTSNYVTYKHFIQLSAYRELLRTVNCHISGCIILQLNKNVPSFREYMLDFNNIDHYTYISNCYKTFCSLLASYFNRLYIEQQFRSVVKATRRNGA